MSLWKAWCEQVTSDVRGLATPVEAAELREPGNLIAWLRALNYAKADVDAHIGDSRLRLQSMSPPSGTAPSPEYILAKREHDERHARRVKFKRGVEQRLEECRYLLDVHAINPRGTYGGMVSNLARIVDLLERDDLESALALAKQTVSCAEQA